MQFKLKPQRLTWWVAVLQVRKPGLDEDCFKMPVLLRGEPQTVLVPGRPREFCWLRECNFTIRFQTGDNDIGKICKWRQFISSQVLFFFFLRYLSNPKVVFSNIKLWVTQSSKSELLFNCLKLIPSILYTGRKAFGKDDFTSLLKKQVVPSHCTLLCCARFE